MTSKQFPIESLAIRGVSPRFGKKAWQRFLHRHEFSLLDRSLRRRFNAAEMWQKGRERVAELITRLAFKLIPQNRREANPLWRRVLSVSVPGIEPAPVHTFVLDGNEADVEKKIRRSLVRYNPIYTDGLGKQALSREILFVHVPSLATGVTLTDGNLDQFSTSLLTSLVGPPQFLTEQAGLQSLDELEKIGNDESLWTRSHTREAVGDDSPRFGFRSELFLSCLYFARHSVWDSFQRIMATSWADPAKIPEPLRHLDLEATTAFLLSDDESEPVIWEADGSGKLYPRAGTKHDRLRLLLDVFDADFLTSALPRRSRRILRSTISHWERRLVQEGMKIIENPGIYCVKLPKMVNKDKGFGVWLMQDVAARHRRILRTAIENLQRAWREGRKWKYPIATVSLLDFFRQSMANCRQKEKRYSGVSIRRKAPLPTTSPTSQAPAPFPHDPVFEEAAAAKKQAQENLKILRLYAREDYGRQIDPAALDSSRKRFQYWATQFQTAWKVWETAANLWHPGQPTPMLPTTYRTLVIDAASGFREVSSLMDALLKEAAERKKATT